MSPLNTLYLGCIGVTSWTSVIIFVLVFLIGYYWMTTPSNLPPGPPGLPVVGNLVSMARAGQDLMSLLKEWRRKYGDVFCIRMGSKYMVVINTYKMMHDTFVKQGDVFSGRPAKHIYIIQRVIQALGKGLIMNDGPMWKELRRLTLMTMRDLGVGKKTLEQRVQDEARAIVKAIDKGQGHPLFLKDLVSKFTSNIICSVIFGERFEYDNETLIKLIDMISLATKQQIFFSPVNFIPATRVIPSMHKTIDRVVDAFSEVDVFLGKILKEHEMTYDPSEIRDFVDLYIKTREDSDNSYMFQAANLRRVINDLFGAGTETTATTLDWTILYLIAYPDVQKKCQQQVDRAIGDRMVTMEDRKDLPYIMAVITEIFRLVPIVPTGLPHNTTREGKVGGYTVPKDTIVVVNINEIHHDPANWTDPLDFKPERFLDNQGQFCPPKENFIPFSIGPRVCLGESLARMELFILLSTLMQTFTFTLPQGHKPDLEGQLGVVYGPKVHPVLATRRK